MDNELQGFEKIIESFRLEENLKIALRPARATGALDRSITETFTDKDEVYTYVLSALEYINNLKQGVGSKSITLEKANIWRLAKGVNASPYAIARSINTFGTLAAQNRNPYYNDPVGETITPEIISNIVDELSKFFVTTIVKDGRANL